jgi:hypothetical protein
VGGNEEPSESERAQRLSLCYASRMSKVVIYSIVAVVPDDCTNYYPTAVDTKYNYITDLVAYTVEEVDEDWLAQVKEKVSGQAPPVS